MDHTVDIEKLVFSYRPPNAVLKIRELAIAKGEKLFLHGPSGSGKTTLLGILSGVLKANEGSIKVLEQDLARMSSPARDALRGASEWRAVRKGGEGNRGAVRDRFYRF